MEAAAPRDPIGVLYEALPGGEGGGKGGQTKRAVKTSFFLRRGNAREKKRMLGSVGPSASLRHKERARIEKRGNGRKGESKNCWEPFLKPRRGIGKGEERGRRNHWTRGLFLFNRKMASPFGWREGGKKRGG